MEPLTTLAAAIGLQREWTDVTGRTQIVSDASLARIAGALGYPADTAGEAAASLTRAQAEAQAPPAMLVTEVGRPTPLPANLRNATLAGAPLDTSGWTLPPIDRPGYHSVELDGHAFTLAVAPRRAPSLADLAPDRPRAWGVGVQIPALRGAQGPPFGTFAELADAVRVLARHGADAVAINPVHALFPGWGHDFSPYSPSSRLHLNSAMGDPALVGLPPLPADEVFAGSPLIDWEAALPRRLAQLRALFEGLGKADRARIEAGCAALDEGVRLQAVFDALDGRHRSQGARGWQDWPVEYHDPRGEAVARFADDHADEVAFHLFAQWLAREGLANVQAEARGAGMAIGLVADLAVGVHTGGSDAWTMRGDMLEGLTIGAPPDPLGPHGQNWALTSFSPQGLARRGYAPWIAMLRSALSLAGGLRIDHAFGLARLWVVPDGEPSSAGAYLTYPFEDLLRLATLEAHLAGALLIAEDLGTTPRGFSGAIGAKGLLGMRVLWFERAADGGFIGAADYDPDAVAMTGTHDTATVAGWWSGRDLDWADHLGRLREGQSRAESEAERDWDRGLLWASLTHDAEARPPPDDPAPVCAAALEHIGRSPCALAIAPLEDLIAEPEQPNLPGTIAEHPNWRRRLPAPLAELLSEPATASRVATLTAARGRSPAGAGSD